MVQMARLAEIAAAWDANGGGECDHPKVDVEYYLGSQTSDEWCMVCGASWPRGKKPQPAADL
jgi:hypothetical protein